MSDLPHAAEGASTRVLPPAPVREAVASALVELEVQAPHFDEYGRAVILESVKLIGDLI